MEQNRPLQPPYPPVQPPYPPVQPPQPAMPYAPVYTPPQPKRTYTTVETVFAWLAWLFGYLFCRAFPVGDKPLGGLLFLILLFGGTAAVLKARGTTLGRAAIVVGASGLAAALSLFFSANAFIHTLAYLYALATYAYFVYAALGNRLERGFSNLLPMDFLKALLMVPFSAFGHLLSAIASKKSSRLGGAVKKVLLGVGLAFLPTVIILVLLSYDADFTGLLNTLFHFSLWDVFSHLTSLLIGLPVGMYIYGLYIASADNHCRDSLTAAGCHQAAQKLQIAPATTVLVAVLPVLFLYVIFFISQWKYYVSGFVGVLPDATSYAAYAREGFFQLCAVSVINLILIGLISLFIRRAEGRSVVLQVLSVLFSLFTLVLISTAVAKLVMYIDRYGLTQKRVYAAWFMAVLALIFLLLLVKPLLRRIKLLPCAAVIGVVMFIALGLCGVDGIIAGYNVDRYLDGRLETLDPADLADMGQAALPHILRLEKHLESKHALTWQEQTLLTDLNSVSEQIQFQQSDAFFATTLPSLLAKQAIEEAGG